MPCAGHPLVGTLPVEQVPQDESECVPQPPVGREPRGDVDMAIRSAVDARAALSPQAQAAAVGNPGWYGRVQTQGAPQPLLSAATPATAGNGYLLRLEARPAAPWTGLHPLYDE